MIFRLPNLLVCTMLVIGGMVLLALPRASVQAIPDDGNRGTSGNVGAPSDPSPSRSSGSTGSTRSTGGSTETRTSGTTGTTRTDSYDSSTADRSERSDRTEGYGQNTVPSNNTQTTATRAVTSYVTSAVSAAYSALSSYATTVARIAASPVQAVTRAVVSVATGTSRSGGEQFADLPGPASRDTFGSGNTQTNSSRSDSISTTLIDPRAINSIRTYISGMEPVVTNTSVTQPGTAASAPQGARVTGEVRVTYVDERGVDRMITVALNGSEVPVINVPSGAERVVMQLRASCSGACLTYTGDVRDNLRTVGQLSVDISRPVTQSSVVGAATGNATTGTVGQFVEIRLAGQVPTGASAEQLRTQYTRLATQPPAVPSQLTPANVTNQPQLPTFTFTDEAVTQMNQFAYEAALVERIQRARANGATEAEWNQLYSEVDRLLKDPMSPYANPEIDQAVIGFTAERRRMVSEYVEVFNETAEYIQERENLKRENDSLMRSRGNNDAQISAIREEIVGYDTVIVGNLEYLEEVSGALEDRFATGQTPASRNDGVFRSEYNANEAAAAERVLGEVRDTLQVMTRTGATTEEIEALLTEEARWKSVLNGVRMGLPLDTMVDLTRVGSPAYAQSSSVETQVRNEYIDESTSISSGSTLAPSTSPRPQSRPDIVSIDGSLAPSVSPRPVARPAAPTDGPATELAGTVQLIGLYGSDASKRALVRVNGDEFVQVKVGQNVGGGITISNIDLRTSTVSLSNGAVLGMPDSQLGDVPSNPAGNPGTVATERVAIDAVVVAPQRPSLIENVGTAISRAWSSVTSYVTNRISNTPPHIDSSEPQFGLSDQRDEAINVPAAGRGGSIPTTPQLGDVPSRDSLPAANRSATTQSVSNSLPAEQVPIMRGRTLDSDIMNPRVPITYLGTYEVNGELVTAVTGERIPGTNYEVGPHAEPVLVQSVSAISPNVPVVQSDVPSLGSQPQADTLRVPTRERTGSTGTIPPSLVGPSSDALPFIDGNVPPPNIAESPVTNTGRPGAVPEQGTSGGVPQSSVGIPQNPTGGLLTGGGGEQGGDSRTQVASSATSTQSGGFLGRVQGTIANSVSTGVTVVGDFFLNLIFSRDSDR